MILGIEIVIHLSPEHFAGICGVCIIEGAYISYPVMDGIFHCLLIHPAMCIEFLIIIGVAIEFGPYTDHEASVHLMYTVQHSLRVGIAGLVKLMTAPLVIFPVVPVLYDIINRNMALAEFAQCLFDITAGLITLATLPESQCPFRHHLSLTGKLTITADDLIHILATYEIIIHIRRPLTPDGELILLFICLRHSSTQSTVTHTAVGLPLYAQRHSFTLLHGHYKLIGIGVPGCTPALGHYQFAIEIHLHISCIIEDEVIIAAGGSFDGTFVYYMRTFQLHLRQIDYRACILNIKGIFIAHP